MKLDNRLESEAGRFSHLNQTESHYDSHGTPSRRVDTGFQLAENEESKSNRESAAEDTVGDFEDIGAEMFEQSKRTPKGRNQGIRSSQFNLRTTMPVLKLNVPLSCNSSDLFEIFSLVSKKEKFQVIEMDQTIATAVNKVHVSIKQMLMNCLPFGHNGHKVDDKESPISAVRLQLSVNDLKGCRKVTLKGLYGDQDLL